MVTVTRGDVVLCDLNPVLGTEQAGIRPVVILQIDRANAVSPHTIIAPFTSKIRRALLASHVFVPSGVGGLTQDSVAEDGEIIQRAREDNRVVVTLDEDFHTLLALDEAVSPSVMFLTADDDYHSISIA
ncbi:MULTISPECIES: DUF5615 family PIN-like protein [Aerosakkonema]|uniref:DUF5615 family PIN-like protein n=1 Tax=Aerosakkonema TaxID=1246629 RepID=UPI0035B9E51D